MASQQLSYEYATDLKLQPVDANITITESQKSEWLKVDGILSNWLLERQELILKLCSIYKPSENDRFLVNKIQNFCEVLLDYVSAGHFEVYENLINEAAVFRDEYLSLTEPLYELIGHSTEQAISFNEKYETRELCSQLSDDLPLDLSKLGEALEARFEAEDELIKSLHDCHKDRVA